MIILILFLIVNCFSWNTDSCLLTVVVYSFKNVIEPSFLKSIKYDNCNIQDIYYVRDITYDDKEIASDDDYLPVKVVRTNVEYNGFLPTLLPLFHESTYSVIINADRMSDINEVMVDDYVEMGNDAEQMYVFKNSGIWAIFCRSMIIRYIWTMTNFEVSSENALDSMVTAAYTLKMNVWLAKEEKPYSGKYGDYKVFSCGSARSQGTGVGIVISEYKRNYIGRQVQSLIDQSYKVDEIIIHQNLHFMNYKDTARKYNLKHVWMTNWNSFFYMRFITPFLLKSYHIISLDDDIIFGKDIVAIAPLSQDTAFEKTPAKEFIQKQIT